MPKRIKIAVVIATHNRPFELANRSLQSVSKQTLLPDFLIIIDDSDSKYHEKNHSIVNDTAQRWTKTVYLNNYRTSGASGSWNTAFTWLQDHEPDVFVAILDDDDQWEPEYLEECAKAVETQNLDMVVAGLIRHDDDNPDGRPQSIPEHLDAERSLIENIHIQGSNLFIRLRTLLQAGGFDEALKSTTDRDLCIRLADIGTVRFGKIDKHLVHHYAITGPDRLSTRGSQVKLDGLTQFYQKHCSRMSTGQQKAFSDRCMKLFHWRPHRVSTSRIGPVSSNKAKIPRADSQLSLVIGIISSSDLNLLRNLLSDLSILKSQDKTTEMTVLVLENSGRSSENRKLLKLLAEKSKAQGFSVRVIPNEQQVIDIKAGLISDIDIDNLDRKSISISRTLLQHYLYEEGQLHPGALVWILDDDSRTNNLLFRGDASIIEGCEDLLQNLRRLKDLNVGIALGTITGDPPLPFTSCIRTQLVDLYHNLEWMATSGPNKTLPDAVRYNMALRSKHHDYYYDLSRHETDHLETPFAFQPEYLMEDVRSAFKRMISSLPSILSGREVFRPLVDDATKDPFERILPSIHRGGNTIISHLSVLRDFPNAVPKINDKYTRRSDMVWCLLNRFVGGRKVIEVPIPVRQDRIAKERKDLDFDKLIEDIHGYALYSMLQDIFQAKADRLQQEGKNNYGPELLDFTDNDLAFGERQYRKYIEERTKSFVLSYMRILGLIQTLKKYYTANASKRYWWIEDPSCKEAIETLRKFNEDLERIYSEDRLIDFKKKVLEIDPVAIRDYLNGLHGVIDEFKSVQSPITKAFKIYAKRLIEEKFQVSGLRSLGHGEEGIVFTDGKTVYKYFYHWKKHIHEKDLKFLNEISKRSSGHRTIYPFELVQWDLHKVITYPYEPSENYSGGHLEDILVFLQECKELGIVFRNMHPDNFRITKKGLRLIDYGADIQKISPDGFEHMCRRAYLMYRYHFRPDLKQLMTRALREKDLPELYRFESFERALYPREIHEILYPAIIEKVMAYHPSSVLDFGCGSGKVSEELSSKGIKTVGYDVDKQIVSRCRGYQSNVEYYGPGELSALKQKYPKFDMVICNIVLCVIKVNTELLKVLTDIRSLVKADGRVLISVCNPFYTFTERTELQQRTVPKDKSYKTQFVYKTRVLSTGNLRDEVHRPFDSYIKEFQKAGFEIETVSETDGADISDLHPASDFLVFELKPQPVNHPPKVSLLIKTCAMEWEWIEKGVRHLVKQLEMPTPFFEKIIVTDGYSKEFLRQYKKPDQTRFKAALDRLLKDHIVDRVVYALYDRSKIKKTNRKWFGLDTAATYAQNGQNVYPTLFGLESCKGDYILQVDSDLLIGRMGPIHDYLNEMVNVLMADPKAITVSFNILHENSVKYSYSGTKGPWRVEVRNCLLDRKRVLSALPLPNGQIDDTLELAWHRAIDKKIQSSKLHSYRGGDKGTFFIHVPNNRKKDTNSLYYIMDRVEDSFVLPDQDGNVDLVGGLGDWAGPKRNEPFIFIICARNVDPGKFKDCWNSILAQDLKDWGAVIIDGASDNGLGDYIDTHIRPFRSKVTFIREKDLKGLLYSTWLAITHFCSNKESIILTLDADDALIGHKVLDRVKQEYDNGADATVGTMLRTDKYKQYTPDLEAPRGNRGGNVWQHLRTFRKYLFDQIEVEDLQIDGAWIDIATDWAFMLPIIEMARNPRHIEDVLYFYEPSAEAPARRTVQEHVIKKIVAKKKYKRLGAEELPLTIGISKAKDSLARESKIADSHLTSVSLARTKYKGRKGLRLHWGCGKRCLNGWINIDIKPGADLTLDIREEWPFGNSSVKEVFMEHVLEHLEYPDEVDHVLWEIYRVLEPGGRLRIGVPDTEWPIQAYVEGPDAEYFKLCKTRWHPKELKTRMEHINYHFRDGWGEHKYAYDEETLRQTLKKQGFHDIERSKFDKRMDSRRRAKGTLYMTAIKPTYR